MFLSWEIYHHTFNSRNPLLRKNKQNNEILKLEFSTLLQNSDNNNYNPTSMCKKCINASPKLH